jgi:arylamine N-acetyltransferase
MNPTDPILKYKEMIRRAGEYGVSSKMIDSVLDKLGLLEWPEVSVDGLRLIFTAWCRNVPQDNTFKRLYFGNGWTGPLPLNSPHELFEAFLEHSTGATCWGHAMGLYSLLKIGGFDARVAAGSMVGSTPPENGPSHGTVIVAIDGHEYLVDGMFQIEEIVPLYRDRPSVDGPMPFTVKVYPNSHQLWDIVFRMGHSEKEITCRLEVDGEGLPYIYERWENTRNYSMFNSSLYIRKNKDGRALILGRNKFFTLHEDGSIAMRLVDTEEERKALLVNVFGLSARIVNLLPADNGEGRSFV